MRLVGVGYLCAMTWSKQRYREVGSSALALAGFFSWPYEWGSREVTSNAPYKTGSQTHITWQSISNI